VKRILRLVVLVASASIGSAAWGQLLPSSPPLAPWPSPLVVPPPPPVLPELLAPGPPQSSRFALGRCVANLGQVGCAARLYAQLLCDNIGLQTPLDQLHQSLQSSFEQAAIDFQGVTPTSIETAAVRYYAPQLFPLKIEKIFDLLQRQSPPSQARSLPGS
jgi:hypothetical protein